ncbi:MAG: FliH/SctL family protein [Lacipirellulaceae bacterium]
MATIIRKHASEAPAGEAVRPVTFAFHNIEERGAAYVRSVREQAAKAVQDANAEAEAVRSRAEAAGRRAAEAAIGELLDNRLGELLATLRPALDGVVAKIETARGEWLDHWQHATLDLAVAIAERIVRRELEREPELTLTWVREALELAAGSSEASILLNPLDYEHLKNHVALLATSVARIANPTVAPDESVSPGGCVVRTKHGLIDARLETQLAQLADELNG